VVSTQAAWHEGDEVVEVRYRPQRIPFADLLASAEASDCAARVYTTTDGQLALARAKLGERAAPLAGALERAKDEDQLYYLRKSPLRALDLTPLQQRRVNAALGLERDPAAWLSPRQLARAQELPQDGKDG